MEQVTLGNIITIGAIAIGFIIQYIAIVVKFSERVTTVEVKQKAVERDLGKLTSVIENCSSKK